MSRAIKIKVCGLLFPENVEAVSDLKPDYAGYIFYPPSRRFVGEKPDPAIFRISTSGVEKVGVFVNEEISKVMQIFTHYHLDLVQLHGSESPLYCQRLKEEGIPVIKVLKPDVEQGDGIVEEYKDVVRYFLFDTPGQEHGGTGQKFDWDFLNRISVPLPYILSGGIGPEDVNVIRNLGHETLFGIDVNSRFELFPGMKDINLLKKFISEIRS